MPDLIEFMDDCIMAARIARDAKELDDYIQSIIHELHLSSDDVVIH